MSVAIKPIDNRSTHKLCSGQVILNLASAVKELIENSIDAGATSIEVKFKNNGQDGFEVVDNGIGIHESNFETIALRYYTSKIESFDDLDHVMTFGFRGEALSSLCALSNLSITTATREGAPMGVRLEYDVMGQLTAKTPVARAAGTTVHISNMFHSLPVRQREFNRNIKRDYGKALGLIQAYAVISKDIRIIVTNQTGKGQPTRVMSTNGNPLLVDNISNVFGSKMVSQIVPFSVDISKVVTTETMDEDQRTFIEGHISKPQWGYGRSSSDRQYVYINGRPCTLPKVTKAFNEVYHSFVPNQYPFIVANIIIPTDAYDVNVTPDKRTIYLHNENAVIAYLLEHLSQYLEPNRSSFEPNLLPQTDTVPDLLRDQPAISTAQSIDMDESTPFPTFASIDNSPADDNDDFDDSGEQGDVSTSLSSNPESQDPPLITVIHSRYRPNFYKQWSSPRSTSSLSKRPQESILDYVSKRSRPMTEDEREEDSGHEENGHEDRAEDVGRPPNEDDLVDDASTHVDHMNTNLPIDNERPPSQSPSPMITLPEPKETSHYLWKTLHEKIDVDVPPFPQRDSNPHATLEDDTKRTEVEHQLLQKANITNATDHDIAAEVLNRTINKEDFKRMQIIGQFNLGFIVTRLDDDDLYIVDQHAADEKYNFETLQRTSRIDGQRLIKPHRPDLTAPEELVVLQNLDVFRANGFEVEAHPDNPPASRILVTSQPVSKNTMFDTKDFGELVYHLTERPGEMVRCSRTRAMLASRACRKSVMIGDALARRQMTTIVRHMGEIDQPWNCPHGRPTMRHLYSLSKPRRVQRPSRDIHCFGSLFNDRTA